MMKRVEVYFEMSSRSVPIIKFKYDWTRFFGLYVVVAAQQQNTAERTTAY